MTVVIGTIIALFEVMIIIWQISVVFQLRKDNEKTRQKQDSRIDYIEVQYSNEVKQLLNQNKEILKHIRDILKINVNN